MYGNYEGIYTNRSKTAIVAITDGTSNTLAFGEVSSTQASFDLTNGAITYGWLGAGALGTIRGLAPGQANDFRTFSSFHTGIVLFALGDGSVRSLRYGATTTRSPTPSNDWYVLQQMAGMRDGGALDTSSVLN